MEKKKFQINCGMCNATGVKEEHLAPYENVQINAGTVVVTPETQVILASHGVSINCGDIISVPAGVEMMVKMGSYTITPDNIPEKPTALIVVGCLTVESGSGGVVDAYAAVQVTGTLTCPRSLAGKIQVTGGTTLYPDGATPMGSPLIVDRLFVKRASGKFVYAKTVVITDAKADIAALKESGTRLACERAVIAESLLDDAISLLADSTKIVTVPDGCVYLESVGTFSPALIRKYGKRLFIDGDLFVDKGAEDLLTELEYLNVAGAVQLPKELEDAFYAVDTQCDELALYRGKLIRDKNEVTVDAGLLEREEFVTILNAALVELAPELTLEEIVERLEIRACGEVACSSEQKTAAEQVSVNVGNVHVMEEIPSEAFKKPEDPNTVRVNCGIYKF